MNDYTERLVQVMLDLVNSYDPYLKEPETLPTPAELDKFLEAHHIIPSTPASNLDLLRTRQTRQRLRESLDAPEADLSAVILNDLLEKQPVKLRLRTGRDSKAHLEYFLPDNAAVSGVKRLEMESVVGLALALEEVGKDRLKSCNASPCQEVYVDLSKNRSRRFCSDRCANRYNIAAFRERHAQG